MKCKQPVGRLAVMSIALGREGHTLAELWRTHTFQTLQPCCTELRRAAYPAALALNGSRTPLMMCTTEGPPQAARSGVITRALDPIA